MSSTFPSRRLRDRRAHTLPGGNVVLERMEARKNMSRNYAHNALNRPVRFDNEAAGIVITADYDYMGRRVFKKVEMNASVTSHLHFLYRGYLQIAALDLTRATQNAMWLITWDPTATVATRPLAIQQSGTWYTYGLDLPKSVTELYGTNGYIVTAYTYSPYGLVTTSGSVTQSPRGLGGGLDKPAGFAPQGRAANGVAASQPIQWSSEYTDTDLGLVYYNYRHYNPLDGRWTGRDMLASWPMYVYCKNIPIAHYDILGNIGTPLAGPAAGGYINPPTPRIKFSQKSGIQVDVVVSYEPEKIKLTQEYAFLNNLSQYAGYISRGIHTFSTRIFMGEFNVFKVQHVSDINEFNPSLECSKRECISKLIIFAHGYYDYNKEERKWEALLFIGGKALAENRDGTKRQISNLILENLDKIPLCRNSEIIFRTCEIGKCKEIKERIESGLRERNIYVKVTTYDKKVNTGGF